MTKSLGRQMMSLWLVAVAICIAVVIGRLASRPALSARMAPEAGLDSPAWTTSDTVVAIQDYLRLNPDNAAAFAQLGLTLLQQVRETGDTALYSRAETAFTAALDRDPDQLDALIGQGLLALARHEFVVALEWGEQARAVNPHRAQVYGIIGDAQVELGQYDAAVDTIQTMVDTRPDLNAYSRVSYLRELHGDIDGAVAAMRQAVAAGDPTAEATLWAQVQLGHLYFNRGDLGNADQIYRQALRLKPDYVHAWAGVARVQAARGDDLAAIETYETVINRLPWPEYIISLGELYEVTERYEAAQRQYQLVRAIERLSIAAGMNVDLEVALFKADRGLDPSQTVQQARSAYIQRPSVQAADVLAWALYQNGEYAEAYRYSQQALRLGGKAAQPHFHAGMIALALGYETEGQDHLQQALTINPYFSRRYGPQARVLLEERQ